MPRNGFFGVKNSHIAVLSDEDAFTYATPVKIPGTVEIKMEPSVETSTSYGDNEPWLDKNQDNGGTGTISFYDTESTAEMRKLFADIVGFDIDAKGRVLGTSGKKPKKFAFMCEQPGEVISKRRCFLECQLKAPSMDAKTLEEKPDITQLDYDLTWRPVTLPTKWRGSFYDSYSDLEDYDKFFEKVDIQLTPAPESEVA
ncbi:major tail protein [uncultured Senegalimassilia sp.]|uniref:major tail protein n=1 Tax=uncultured Senegalimassilia sp. TaxID=1714350 RepID=UPI0025E062C5|nr:major tail protein [uncultured Senegalimassilia sp.]